MKSFDNMKVFITGGSSGIGRATALQLAEKGADVYIAARGEERLKETLEALKRHAKRSSQNFGMVVVDIADKESVSAMVPQVLGGLNGLDLLINNAGITHPGYIQQIPDDVFEAMMRVNYFGTVNVTRAFLPHFMEQRSGHISCVSSLLGFLGIFGYSAYAASKFAITGFTDCLRQELLPYGVRVSVFYPPDTDTPQQHEENRIKPPETKAISGTVKMMTADIVATSYLEGISSGRYKIMSGFGTKFTDFMHRHFPAVVRWVIDGDLKRYQRKNPPLNTPQ